MATLNGGMSQKGDTYENIMGIAPAGAPEQKSMGGATGLASRLATFRQWLKDDAKIQVHSALCIVNGEATDGTKNAPVLVFEQPTATDQSKEPHPATGRCGVVDNTAEHALYDRTMGCQIRTVREVKKGDVVMNVPRSAMITPDVVAASDAGRAVLACCQPLSERVVGGESIGFWDAFANTAENEKMFSNNMTKSNGTQLLVKILQDRKKAETALSKAQATDASPLVALAPQGKVSTRAPLLAFLIQQRFSNEARPLVSSEAAASELSRDYGAVNALNHVQASSLEGMIATFGPYARILPSAISLPLCWKRNELALLAGCIAGAPLLKEVAAHTAQLAGEFLALVDAGITRRFPTIFTPGMITWERWVWAAAVVASRTLPASCYINKGEGTAILHFQQNPPERLAIRSSPEVWDELGVLIPLFDMLNHEVDSNQITWEPSVPEGMVLDDGDSENRLGTPDGPHGPRAVMHKRVKKGSEVFITYGQLRNKDLLLSYGMAQMNNLNDEVKIGWCLADAVGNVAAPVDFTPPFDDSTDGNTETKQDNGKGLFVYESIEPEAMASWWTQERLALLQRAVVSKAVVANLQQGKKLEGLAYNDGNFDPFILSAAVVGTMPPADVKKSLSDEGEVISLTRLHQRALRHYLGFFFAQKLEKLLQNLNNGLKDHFGVQLWTKVSQGGLAYINEQETAEQTAPRGWQHFFDSTAYTWSLEVEKNFYAVGPDSCVLTLYDGFLRALQKAIYNVSTQERFEETVLKQLKDLEFKVLETEGDVATELFPEEPAPSNPASDNGKPSGGPNGDARKEKAKDGGKGAKRRSRKKGERKDTGDRPPAIKLHVGNLAYTTSINELFDFFADLYGRENILECHIPTERDSGRSRGFGFVTMPDAVAMGALQPGRRHEINGRLLKIEKSNSAGTNRSGRGGPSAAPRATSDRCSTCGYRPKYCVCGSPSGSAAPPPIPPAAVVAPPYYDDPRVAADGYGDPYRDRAYDYYGSRQPSRGSYSHSPSYDRGDRRYRDVARDYDCAQGYERDYYRHERSRSRSRGRDKERRRDRDRRRDRGRSRSRSRDRSGREGSRGSRDWEGRSRRRYSRSRSYSEERSPRRERKSGDGMVDEQVRSRSRSGSPGIGNQPGSERKLDESERKRSRSRERDRERGKSGKRKRSKKERRHARSRSASPVDDHPRNVKL